MRALVVDASVVIKWVVDEPGTEHAVRLMGSAALIAPDLLMSECANILWKKVRRRELSRDEASLAIELLMRADIELVPTRALASAAMALSLDLDHPAYDCIYFALAIERGDPFVTADNRFVRLVADRGGTDLRNSAVELWDVERVLG